MVKSLAKPNDPSETSKTSGSNGSLENVPLRKPARKQAAKKTATKTKANQRMQVIAEKLFNATEEVTNSITDATEAVRTLEGNMARISSASGQSAQAAEKTRTAIESIESTATSSSSKAKVAMDQARDLRSRSADTSEMIQRLIQGVNNTARANIESAEKIAELERQSDEIGNIVNAVARIADQTNLLALNAAIEAARAGEHGKGFAVVADEVRNLAELSEKSARAIQGVVQEIQHQVKAVTQDTETAGSKAKEEVQKAEIITADLGSISINFNGIFDTAQKIVNSAERTNSGALEYLRNAEEIASAAEQASSSVEESSKAVQEESRAFAEMAEAAKSMTRMAEELRNAKDADKTAEELAAAAEEMSANADEIRASASQISVAISEINHAIHRQAEASNDSIKIGAQLDEQAKEMSSVASQSSSLALQTCELLEKNNQNISELIKDIEESAALGNRSAKNVEELRTRMRQIDKIVDMIVNITIQVNMLAVNGNVEAARAGEFGKGFSVVAADIRSLANESSENADKIKDMVRSISDQIAEVSFEIHRAAKTSSEEASRASSTLESLNMLVQETARISSSIKEIETGSDQTVDLLDKALASSKEINQTAEEVSKDTNSASLAANEGANSAAEIANAVEDIASQADELQHL